MHLGPHVGDINKNRGITGISVVDQKSSCFTLLRIGLGVSFGRMRNGWTESERPKDYDLSEVLYIIYKRKYV